MGSTIKLIVIVIIIIIFNKRTKYYFFATFEALPIRISKKEAYFTFTLFYKESKSDFGI